MGMLELQPIDWREANTFIAAHHRHHLPPTGWKFGIAVNGPGFAPACSSERGVVGVITIGRPVARMLDNGWTLEVTRCCALPSYKNASSMLYGAAWRAAKALGYKRLITYTLREEPGISLRAAGWRVIGEAGGGEWGRKSRPRVTKHPTGQKILWEAA
jgi:hypothetical protein